jgi:HSP20 family protein
MNPMRWEPFNAMDESFRRFPNLLDRWLQVGGSQELSTDWTPKVDISETGQEYVLRAALPAVKKEDVKVTLGDGMLTLSGERRRREEQKTEKFHRIENLYGTFSRSFFVPEAIDTAAIRAESKSSNIYVVLQTK